METSDAIEITPYDTPWEIACMLINAEYLSTNVLGQEFVSPFFDKTDLRRIGEHLINYCNVETGKKEESK